MPTFPLAVFGKCSENVPVEGQSGHSGAAAVVAQTGVDPRLGEDDIDLVLLVREQRSQYSDCSCLYLFFHELGKLYLDESGPVLPEEVRVKREQPVEHTSGSSDGNERLGSALFECFIQLNCERRHSSQFKLLKLLNETIWFLDLF